MIKQAKGEEGAFEGTREFVRSKEYTGANCQYTGANCLASIRARTAVMSILSPPWQSNIFPRQQMALDCLAKQYLPASADGFGLLLLEVEGFGAVEIGD